MEPLAHSARPDRGIPTQPYAEHVLHVVERAVHNAQRVATHAPRFAALLFAACRSGAEFHDLGKLDPANQRILAGVSAVPLELNHVDAGVAHLLQDAHTDLGSVMAALIVYAHHRGLPSMPEERRKLEDIFRDCTRQVDGQIFRDIIDGRLGDYLRDHRSTVKGLPPPADVVNDGCVVPLLGRIALSCLADADHADTGRHYGDPPPGPGLLLRAGERVTALDLYVSGLASKRSNERTKLRNEVYRACRDAPVHEALVECDSPVGSGKTTAVMAHLLQAAVARKLRRVIVVLPFTNIIDQSVDVYRKALVLPREPIEEVVAAHHHKAEYSAATSRHLAALWDAPIVVTTAVQFFETLANRSPGGLRKLHQVPGSAIFIDEAHASLPPSLWPQAWDWLSQLVRDWGCHVVLGSGSLNRLWQLPEFVREPASLPQLVRSEVREKAASTESTRISFSSRSDLLTLDSLAAWVKDLDGPRLLIVNTVQTAAALARLLASLYGRETVNHLSTALMPRDRERILKRVRRRLKDKTDRNWTLVATSCVEAGVDVSFRTGLRERASLSSLIQTGGRVNRSGEYGSATVWDIRLQSGGLVRENPGYRDSAEILGQLFNENKIGPDFCTEALRREVRMTGQAELNKKLREAEAAQVFPEVQDLFRVIDQATVTAVVDKGLQHRLDTGGTIDWRELQQLSVQIYTSKTIEFALRDFLHFPDLKAWTLKYDHFLGYMAGVLPLADAVAAGFLV